ncbi:MAG: BlaI/MecI/CopY family transcriptional regulator [Planctomycetes bacterium]|nr:BlaI/MecI/CopY family transcriptional regulator [Planctomycetota bacterium]MBI3847384.1 BlaI/MecI/CopY family transcriptional regulator [Planctomycetota bacterium]
MADRSEVHLSRRERQIMDVVYARGEASVGEILEGLPDPPSYSAVRALVTILESKGHLRHRRVGTKYVYGSARPRHRAAKSALRRLVRTFFDDSPEKAVAALLDANDARLTKEDLDRIAALIEHAKKRGR